MITITRNEFLASPRKYLAYSHGSRQVAILNEEGKPWIVLGNGPQREVTLEEIEAHEKLIASLLSEAGEAPCGTSWFD